MNSKLNMLPMALVLSAGPVLAVTTVPDATMRISMVVADVTCQLNNGQGLSQQVAMPLVSVAELQSGQGKSAEAPLTVNCAGSPSQPQSIILSVQPAAGSSLMTDGSDGQLKTNKPSVGLLLTWKHNGQPVSLTGGEDVFLPAMATGGIWDLGIVARTIAVAGETPTGGEYTGAVTLRLRYT